MTQPGPSTRRHPLIDLVLVAALAAVLWVCAQAIGGITRASSLHPAASGQGAADCPPGGNAPAAHDTSPLAALAVTGACAEAPPAGH